MLKTVMVQSINNFLSNGMHKQTDKPILPKT